MAAVFLAAAFFAGAFFAAVFFVAVARPGAEAAAAVARRGRPGCWAARPSRIGARNVPVALTEALSNAILRGNHEDLQKGVRIRATLDERALILEVEDEGDGFDLDACLIDPDNDGNLFREDGRGLFLMCSLMDRVEQIPSTANVVRLTLHRA